MVHEYMIKHIALHHGRKGYTPAEDYEQLIAKFAKEGWRFVQLVHFLECSPRDRGIDLIFERELKREGSDIL